MSIPTQPLERARRSAIWKKPAEFVVTTLAMAVVIAVLLIVWQQFQPKRRYQFTPATFQFVEHAQSNAPLDADVGSLQFVNIEGKPVELAQFRGQKNVVLVITRGNTSGGEPGAYYYYRSICLYCATQTSRLIANYEALRSRDAEVVVVFPIRQAVDASSMSDFREAIRRDGTVGEPPFPLVLDVELRAVDQLGIRADLSKPATYILDKQGQVRFAYVGETVADRPSVQSMLEQLDAIRAP